MKELVVNKSQITSDNQSEAEKLGTEKKKKGLSLTALIALASSGLAAFTALNATDLKDIFSKTKNIVGNPIVAVIVIAGYVAAGVVSDDQ